MSKTLLTGGLGYIGSHTAVTLIEQGFDICIVDNLSNSHIEVLTNLEKITGRKIEFYNADINDSDSLENIFKENEIDSVIHFAGYKSVFESIKEPIKYYDNNIGGTVSLIKVMQNHSCKNIIFSSSATVYGAENLSPLTETMKKGTCTNPYGKTKQMIEEILSDEAASDENFSVVALRYFNPIGAHHSGLIGENPVGVPNNLMPYIVGVASGRYQELSIFGADYETKDGTAVRDFIHVLDLACGHVKALEYCKQNKGFEAINLGTGNGFSVLEMVNTFNRVNNLNIRKKFSERREGDLPMCYADANKAKSMLNWKAVRTLEDMCIDAWNYELKRLDSGRE